jgi:hypothetical protein
LTKIYENKKSKSIGSIIHERDISTADNQRKRKNWNKKLE